MKKQRGRPAKYAHLYGADPPKHPSIFDFDDRASYDAACAKYRKDRISWKYWAYKSSLAKKHGCHPDTKTDTNPSHSI